MLNGTKMMRTAGLCIGLVSATMARPSFAIEQLDQILIRGSRVASDWGTFGGSSGGRSGTGGGDMALAPEPDPPAYVVVTDLVTDVRCDPTVAIRNTKSTDDPEARQEAARAALSTFMQKYRAATLPISIMSFLRNRGPLRSGDTFLVTFADGGTANYVIDVVIGGAAAVRNNSESNLTGPDPSSPSPACVG